MPPLEPRPSAVAGRGLFLTEPVAAGAAVLRPDGPVHERGHLNHGCDPDLGWDGDVLVALRDLPAGGEVLVDYALSVADPDWFLRCHCPSYRCRQMVEGTDWRIPQLQRRYEGRWAPAVQRLLDDGKKNQA